MERSSKKKVFDFVFLIGLLILTVWAVFKDRDVNSVIRMMREVPTIYEVICFTLVILYVCSESVIIKYLLSMLKIKVKLAECIKYSFIGFFYSCSTPSASGGQPMQIYYMRKNKISVASSSLVLMVVTIEYKFVLVFIGTMIMIFGQGFLHALPVKVRYFLYLGLVLNIICVAVMLMLIVFPQFIRIVLRHILRILDRLKLVRKKENLTKRFDRTATVYKDAAEYLKKNQFSILITTVISFIQRFFLFFVTYVVYRSLGFRGESVIKIMLLQAIISISVDMLPLPGGMGISEHLYLLIFMPVFGSDTMTTAAMALSRGYSYYILLLVSGIIVFAVHLISKNGNNQGDVKRE